MGRTFRRSKSVSVNDFAAVVNDVWNHAVHDTSFELMAERESRSYVVPAGRDEEYSLRRQSRLLG